MTDYYSFPKEFLWGAATASYQVEGAAAEDGRGPSVWDTFSHSPGRVAMDHTGDVAADQYHRYKDDVRLMKRIGLRAYRFSISWSRVLPRGWGEINEPGLAYYEALVDELLANGIEPWPTFFHWDLPQAIEDDCGGWEGRETADRFAEYVAVVTRRLSDRVTNFFTINEFGCFTDSGYSAGVFAPGKQLPPGGRNRVRHNALLAHGRAVQAIRANAARPPNVGMAENPAICVPLIDTAENVAAAATAMRLENAPFLTAVMEGRYPPEYLEAEGRDAPEFSDDDMATIGSALDFVGLNMYAPVYVRAAPESSTGYERVPHPEAYPRMSMPWLYVGPQITYWGPRWLRDIWDVKSVYITENGCACEDRLTPAGEVNDSDRIMYLRNHFIAAHRAVAEGIPLHGYFVWSLMDNFEWACGYGKRFGLVYVNYETLERIPKQSAEFYRECIARNAVV